MSQEKLFHVGVKGLIENKQGQILLLLADVSTHRKNSEPYWDIPGGRIKGSDSLLQTLAREIAEETGIESIEENEVLASVISNHEIPLDNGKMVGLLLVVYKVTVPDASAITLSVEHSEYEWVSKNEAAKRLSHKYPAEFTDLLRV